MLTRSVRLDSAVLKTQDELSLEMPEATIGDPGKETQDPWGMGDENS